MVSQIASTLIGSNAAKKAASLQDRAAGAAADSTLAQLSTSTQNLAPYTSLGASATNALSDQLGLSGNTSAAGYGSLTQPFTLADFNDDPGYQFRMDQGQQALERSSAAKGGLLSGAALKASTEYGQNYASGEYQNAYDRYNTNQNNLYTRLSGQSAQGLSAASGLANLGSSATAAANDYRTTGASARAAGVIGSANAQIGGINAVDNKLTDLVKTFAKG